MIVATLESKPVHGQREGETSTEVGQFSLAVQIEDGILDTSTAPRKLILSTVAQYMASAYTDTKLPPPMWLVYFAPIVIRRYSLPEKVDLGMIDDLYKT